MSPSEKQLQHVATKMDALDTRHSVGTAIKDLFALGCWLHATGHKEAGSKAVDTALKAINLDRTNKTLFLQVVDHLQGNEYRYAMAIQAHVEINLLLESGPSTAETSP
jgi:hypothetical protein